MPAPAIDNVNNFLQYESGRIMQELDIKSRARGYPWTPLVPREGFPLGMGDTLSKITYERTIPNTDQGWTKVTLNTPAGTSPSGSNALIPADQIDPASTNYTYSLYYRALNSNPLTVHDANLSLNFAEQLSAIVKNFEDNILDLWEDRKQDEYDRVCGHKIIAEIDGQPESGFDQPWINSVPTSRLTIEHLEAVYDRMMRDGAAEGLDTVQGIPTPIVIMEPEAWRDIIFNNPEVRDDYRESSESDLLLNPLGISGAYRHMKIAFNYRAPHYDFNGSWIRRPYYDTESATIGTKAEPSVAYREAQYATAYVFHPSVMDLLVYDPKTNFDNGVQFNASDWMGRIYWHNIQDSGNNIDGHTGFFRALMASASKPKIPSYGYAIRYCRSPRSYGNLGCPAQY